MKFTRIRTQNFRILEDIDVDLNFPLIFLNGNNGHGKTSFQTAVAWCLYGENELPATAIEEGMVSQLVIRNTPGKKIFPIAVEIDLDFPEQNRKVNLRREVDWNVEKERSVPSSEKFVVRLTPTDKSGSTEIINPGDAWVRDWLPMRFKNFFLFDGEQMSEFFDSKTQLAVRDAVEEIAQVDLFLELRTRFEGIASTYEAQRSRLGSSGAQEALKKKENAEKLLRITREDLGIHLDDFKKKKKDLEEVRGALKNVEGASQIIESIKAAESDLRVKKSERKIARARYEDAVIARGLFVQLAPAYEVVKKTVERAKAEGWYPIPFDITAMEELLSNGKCICGTDLQKDKSAHELLAENINQRRQAGERGRALQEVFSEVQVTMGRFKIESESVEAASQDLDRAEGSVEKIEDALAELRSDVNHLLAGMSLEDAEKLGKREARLAEELNELEAKILWTKDTEIPRLEEALTKAGKAYEKLTKQDAASSLLLKKRDVAMDLAKSAEAVYQQAVEKVREALQQEISRNFNRIIGGEEFVTKIDDEFTIKTFTETGRPAPLSSGQNMLKGYVFTVAMRRIVGLYFPLIVDTPLGRLSEEYRDELGKFLTEFVKSMKGEEASQVIFLMHDGEYTPYTQDRFSSLKPKELFFQWEVPKQKSIVGEGINPEWKKVSAWADRKAGKI